jgi:AcrR family transcriptional regulator
MPRPSKPRPTRALILRHAINLFARRGFDGVSVRDVAGAVGVAMPTLYHHFGSKRTLYLESCLWLFDRWGKRLGLLLEREGTAYQRLYFYYTGLIDSLTRDWRFSALLQRELLERDAAGIRKLTRQIFSTHFQLVLRLCQELGCRSRVELTAHTLYALSFGLAQLRPIGHELGVVRGMTEPGQLALHVLNVALPHCERSSVRSRKVAG